MRSLLRALAVICVSAASLGAESPQGSQQPPSTSSLSQQAPQQPLQPPLAQSQTPAANTGLPGTPKPLTLQEAESIALKNNPQITVGKLLALQSHQFVTESRSALLPNAFLSITGVGANAGSRVAAGALNNPVIFPRVSEGATVSQLITDFGRTTNLLSSSKFQAAAADQNAIATRDQIILVVDQAFYNVLDNNALVLVAQETVKARQTMVDQIGALTKAKLKSDLDLSFARVDLARGKLLLLEAQNSAMAALAQLSAVLGYPDIQNFAPVEEQFTIAPPAPDVAPLIRAAMQQRPEIASLQAQVESAQKYARAEHDLWMPTVSALGVVGEAPIRDPHIPNWYGAAGVNINIPVFNGFLYNARAKSADLQTEVNRQRLSDLRNSIARDVRDAWQDTNRAFERLSVTQQLEEEATLAINLSRSRYNLGLGSIVELSQAQLQKTQADIDVTDARYQYRLSQILLAYATASPH